MLGLISGFCGGFLLLFVFWFFLLLLGIKQVIKIKPLPLVCSSCYLLCWPQSQQVNNSSFKAETLCHISLFEQLLLQTFKPPFLHYIVVFLASCLNISSAIGTENNEDHLKLLQQFLQISLLWPLWLRNVSWQKFKTQDCFVFFQVQWVSFIKLQVFISYFSPSILQAFLSSVAFFGDGIHLSYSDSHIVEYYLLWYPQIWFYVASIFLQSPVFMCHQFLNRFCVL